MWSVLCGMSRETWRGALEMTAVLTPQLLNHNYKANTIEYNPHTYNYKYNTHTHTNPVDSQITRHPVCGEDDEDPLTALLSSKIAPLPHPPHPPPCIFSEGQLVGDDLSLLIDVLLSTLNSALFLSHHQVSHQIVAPRAKHPFILWKVDRASEN